MRALPTRWRRKTAGIEITSLPLYALNGYCLLRIASSRVHISGSDGISIGSVVLAQLVHDRDEQREKVPDHATAVSIDRMHLVLYA